MGSVIFEGEGWVTIQYAREEGPFFEHSMIRAGDYTIGGGTIQRILQESEIALWLAERGPRANPKQAFSIASGHFLMLD